MSSINNPFNIGKIIPNYNASVSRALGTTYTAVQAGVVFCSSQIWDGHSLSATINNHTMKFAQSLTSSDFGSITFAVDVGDTYKVTSTTGASLFLKEYQFLPYREE